MAFSVTLNAEDSNATSKVDTNVTEKVADDINDGWWDDSDLDTSDVLAVQAENQVEWNWKDIKAENQAAKAENQVATEKLKQINDIALWH